MMRMLRLDDVCLKKLAETPDAHQYWWDGHWYTRAHLLELTEQCVVRLQESGFQEGQRLVVLMPNCPMILALSLAVWKLKGAIVPLNVKSGMEALLGTLDLVEPFALVLSEEVKNEAGEELTKHGHLWTLCREEGPLPPLKGKLGKAEDASLAVIFATSGTTGLPKAVPLSHDNLFGNCEGLLDSVPQLNGEDNVLCVLPNFHSFGYTLCFIHTLWIGGKHVLVPGFFPPQKTYEAICDANVTVLFVVPTMLSYLLSIIERGAATPQTLRLVVTGGDRLNVQLDAKAQERLGVGVLEGYGLTETSPLVSINPSYENRRLGTVGPFIKGYEWQVRTEAGDVIPDGREGVLWVRGTSVTDRYFRDEIMTAERFKEGWFNTGDYVCIEEGDYIRVLDRVTDIIIVGGFNVYPQEVERILHQHPDVQTATVVGIPNNINGQLVKAFILKKPGAAVTEMQIIRYCKANLAHFKVPRKIEFVDKFPLSGTGKILRRVLREKGSTSAP